MTPPPSPPPAKPRCSHCGAILAPDGCCWNCRLYLGLGKAAAPDAPGEETDPEPFPRRFGAYELLGQVAEGGMGVVYRARQPGLDRTVALKVVRAGLFATPAERQRFQTEAEAAASLDHPHIVPIYEVGEADGQPYFTMKLVAGLSLERVLARQRELEQPQPDRAFEERMVALLAKVARAVHHAHQRGILHRDLKPANILLDAADEPHVTDFGLAKRLNVTATGLTLTGQVLGTPGYMAPEQAAGDSKGVTVAADIFSLGAILYEVLTGRTPFRGDTPLAVMLQTVQAEPPRPSAIRPSVDRDLQTICLQCLAKSPTARYRSAESLAEDLERWLRHEPISARPPTAWERLSNQIRFHPVRTGLTAVALLAVLLAATFAYASTRTYLWLMDKIADEHLIVPPGTNGVYQLKLAADLGRDRCTYNFWKVPFWSKRGSQGRYARLELTNLPPALARQLQLRVFGDIVARPDDAKTPPLTNGQVFFIGESSLRERAF